MRTIIDLKTDSFDRLPEGFAGNAVRADGTDEDDAAPSPPAPASGGQPPSDTTV